MSHWIVITSINPPTDAIRRVSEIVASTPWRAVVVGDRKTPPDWTAAGIDYLSFDAQLAQFGELAEQIPANHYCRKNLGYLYAAERGADVILETDDDNIPGPGFAAQPSPMVTADLVGGARWANVYSHFASALIWPRGNPLDTIHEAGVVQDVGRNVHAPVQQFLADGDPDVDAIYRLLFKSPLNFRQRAPIALAKGTWCSFNSQNTLFFKEAFPLLYLPCHVSFRMTDIWRSFVAQAALWHADRQLVFRAATVVQERNQHDLMKDFKDEVDGYLHNDRIASTLISVLERHPAGSISAFAAAAWQALLEADVLKPVEIEIHRAWARRMEAAG